MEINKILKENDFTFEKKFGQNFITDNNLLSAIVKDCCISKDDEVLEIGAGAGTLTNHLCHNAKKVVSFEIDTRLQDVLKETLKEHNNSTVIFKDIMQEPLENIEKLFDKDFHLIANLPYYITTPIIFKFLESKKIQSICVMVQKEVGERICAKTGKDYGILSLMVDFYGNAKIVRYVSRKLFTPEPNVDSVIVKIDIVKNKFDVDADIFSKIVHSAFSMRRKTLVNNLMQGFKMERTQVENWIAPLDKQIRAENLSINDFVDLAKKYKR